MSDATYTEIYHDSLDEAAEVLALAFENDPFIRYVLSHHGAAYLSQVRELFRFTCEIRLDLGQPVIGTTNGTRLTGVTCISVPGKKEWPTALKEKSERFNSIIGAESAGRLGRFSNLGDQYIPSQPHYHLIVIGTHPDFQGQGLGRVLLDAVNEMSESHPASTGIRLESTNPVNVPLYEYFGYHLVSKEKLDDIVDLWFMFRPNNIEN